MLKGEIEIFVRNAETMEVEDHRLQSNIVTNLTLSALTANGANTIKSAQVMATGMVMTPTKNCIWTPTNSGGVPTSTGSVIPGTGNPDWFEASNGTPAFAQWSVRLPLPASTLTYNSVFMTVAPYYYVAGTQDPAYWGGYQSMNGLLAYASLLNPCTQSPTQYFDIYYRIYFPTTSVHDMPSWQYAAMVKRMSGVTSALWTFNNSDYQPFRFTSFGSVPMIVPNPGDEESCWPSRGSSSQDTLGTMDVTAQSVYYRRKYSQNFNIVDAPGVMLSAAYFWAGNYGGITGVSKVDIGTNIQNINGHSASSTVPFLDVSNLQQGTGQIHLGGSWSPTLAAPVAAGLYTPGEFSQMYYINVVDGGAVGTSSYTWWKQPYFGSYIDGSWHSNPCYLPYLGQTMQAGGPVPDQEQGNTLLGDLTKLGIRQLSAWCSYDNKTTIVAVKQDMILIYNIANGTYQKFSGGFTNVCQVCVIGTKVYLGCRSTGLYMIDPANSSAVTHIPSPDVGVDLSTVFGVAEGYGGMLWVVGANCLASFDGATWTAYNETSTPAFVSTNVTNGLWGNIEYLRVDVESPTHQMLLVRRYDASVGANSFGVWWSLDGVATSLAAEPLYDFGNPRINKCQCGGRAGIWQTINYSSQRSRWTFGSPGYTQTTGSDESSMGVMSAVMFAKDSDGVTTRVLRTGMSAAYWYDGGGNTRFYQVQAELRDSAWTAVKSVASRQGLTYDAILPVSSGVYYSVRDNYVTFLVGPGVVFTAKYTGTPGFVAFLTVVPFDSTRDGGVLAYLGRKSYGWTGSEWSEAVTTPRPTHSSVQTLDRDMTVAFANGASGTSFVANNWYNFVTCVGLMKDNTTSSSFEYAFYYKKTYKASTVLSSYTVPAVTTMAAYGVVGLNSTRSSSTAITQNGSNQFVFPGGNPGQYAVGDKQVTGDFTVEYTPTAGCTYVAMGIGHAGTGTVMYGFTIAGDGQIYTTKTGNDDAGPMLNYTTWNASGAHGALSAATTVTLQRVGVRLNMLVNGSVVDWVDLPGAKTRWDLISQTWCNYTARMNEGWQLNRVAPACTITTNGSDNAVSLGTFFTATGAFNPLYYAVDSDTRNINTVTINGNPVIAYHYDGTLPGINEVTIDPMMGTLHFNAGNVGQAITAAITYMTHE
jgi:hypothetical protein